MGAEKCWNRFLDIGEMCQGAAKKIWSNGSESWNDDWLVDIRKVSSSGVMSVTCI